MDNLSKLKLCFLAGTLEHGGAERQLFYVLQTLCRKGTVPRLLSLDRDGFWAEKIKSLGVPVTWIGGTRSRLRRLFRILKETRKGRPHALQSQHFYLNAYAGLAARLIGTGSIGAMRSDGRSEAAKTGRLGGWFSLHCPRTIAANSQSAIDYAVTRGVPRDRIYFMPNVVDTKCFHPPGEATPKPLTLITVGRLVEEKRFDRFISIVSQLRTFYGVNVRGLIVGPETGGHLKLQLEYQARRLGLLPGDIQFRDGTANLLPVYHEATACLLTSDYEGTPNVLLEAMACGLPVVASKVGGVPDIIRHGHTGFLFDPDDIEGFSATLVELLKNPELRTDMGHRSRAYIEENHSLEQLSKYLEALYDLALPARRPPVTSRFQVVPT